MKWGMPSLIELEDMRANAALCRKLKLEFVELNMNLPMFQAQWLDEATAISDEYGIGFTVHMDENFAPADFNPLISEAWLETMQSTLRAMKRIGAPVLNMHMSKGVYFTLPEGKVFLFDRYRKEYMEKMCRLRDLCESEIAGENRIVCIENTNGYTDFQREAIDFLLESPVFALTWDIGHSHAMRAVDEPFLLERSGRIAHFHIHDVLDKCDHMALGKGEVDLARFLSIADSIENVRCVLETKTVKALESSVQMLSIGGWIR